MSKYDRPIKTVAPAIPHHLRLLVLLGVTPGCRVVDELVREVSE